jgi:SAM-dependent methyltransferase
VTAADIAAGIWERKYGAGHRQLYPWDMVVSFVFRHAPRDRARAEVHILEVGCGTASNLWFAAREGFSVAGIDASAAAIDAARERFNADGLSGDLRVGSFTELPFPDASFDLVIDRGAITCVGLDSGRRAVAEAKRVLRSGGFFLFNPYTVTHSSAAAGTRDPDGLTHDIRGGTLIDVGPICFYDRPDIDQTLGDGWIVRSLIQVEHRDLVGYAADVHAEWRVIAERR